MAAGDISGYALPDYFFTPPLRGARPAAVPPADSLWGLTRVRQEKE